MKIDDLGRIPMSQHLGATLARAASYADAQSHPQVRLEHLLLALTEDLDAASVLKSSDVDIARLASEVSAHVGLIEDRRIDASMQVVISEDLRRILEAAAAAARQGRRTEINGAIVLAAIVGDGKSTAAHLLRAQGLTFEQAIRALRAAPQSGAAEPQPPTAAPQPAPPAPRGSTDDFLASARERVQSRVAQAPPLAAPAVEPLAAPAPVAASPGLSAYAGTAAEPAPRPSGPAAPTPSPGTLSPPVQTAAQPSPPQPSPRPPSPVQSSPAISAPPFAAPPPPGAAPAAAPGPNPRWQRPHPEGLPPAPALQAPPSPAMGPMTGQAGAPRPQPPAGFDPAQNRPVPPHGAPVSRSPQGSHSGGPMPPPPVQQRMPGPPPYPGSGGPVSPMPPPGTDPRLMQQRPPRPGPAGIVRVAAGQLVENIPRRMRVGVPLIVEARVARADVKAIAEGLQGGGAVFRHEVTVTKAMSVRLRAPEGGFWIETSSPETQWIENALGLMADDYASWRWTVTPKDRGRRRLQLLISARTIGSDGVTAETALPDQVIEVRVGINYTETVMQWAGWATAAMIGGVVARFGDGIFSFLR